MYSILLVDDEKMELETLTNYIPWDQMGIKVAGTAKNGREALELTRQLNPDIILTDVRMPIMDGLEFVKRAKQLSKRVKIVFLSGHDEFQYIKAALAVEASGYLLKPLDLDELKQLMEKVKQKCEEAKLTEHSEDMAKEKLLRMLLTEEAPERRADLAGKLLQLNASALPLLQGPYQAAYLAIDSPGHDTGTAAGTSMPEPLERSIGEAVQSRLKALGYMGELLNWEYGSFAAVFPASLFDGERDLWLQLQKLVAADFPVSLKIGLSGPGEKLEDSYTLFKEAQHAAEQSFYFGNGALLSADELREPAMEKVEVEEHQEALCRTIGHQRSEDTEREAALFINRLRESHVHPHLARSAAVRLITAVEKHFSSVLSQQTGLLGSEWEIMNNCGTLDDIGEHIRHVCHRLILALSEKDKDRHQHIAKQIQDTIDRSFHKPLTVEDIAKDVYLSPNYIRTIYKEKTGRTILQAITERRMEHASRLLADKSLKIHEIAGLVGYENVSYFCSIFHKTTSMTPNQYRKQIY